MPSWLIAIFCIADIDTCALQLVCNGLRGNTQRTYTSAQRYYFQFCAALQLQPIPATEQHLLRFVSYAHLKGLSSSTIQVYLSGISSLHTINGLPSPPVNSYRVKLALKAVSDIAPGVRHRLPITYHLLSYIIEQLQPGHHNLLWSAVLSLGFFGALRGSEYTAIYIPPNGWVAPKLKHVVFKQSQGHPAMIFTIPKSKTSSAPIQVPIGCSRTPICAVCTMHTYLRARTPALGLHPESYLFVDAQGRPATKHQLNSIIKNAIHGLGLDSKNYSSHSLRSGAATTASQLGFTEPELKALGHWASQAYTAYVHQDFATNFNYASRLASQTIQ